jgi:hypothetical protein
MEQLGKYTNKSVVGSRIKNLPNIKPIEAKCIRYIRGTTLRRTHAKGLKKLLF